MSQIEFYAPVHYGKVRVCAEYTAGWGGSYNEPPETSYLEIESVWLNDENVTKIVNCEDIEEWFYKNEDALKREAFEESL